MPFAAVNEIRLLHCSGNALSSENVESMKVDELQKELDNLRRKMSENVQATEENQGDRDFTDKELEEMYSRQSAAMGEEGHAQSDQGQLLTETEVISSATESQLEFQAETRKLLDIVARSLYSDREIFIRELISNASDALEKVRYKIITGERVEDPDVPLRIQISADEEKKILIIQDNGIGMTRQELIDDLGRIGHSGTGEYLKLLQSNDSSNLIGQFGVGFYATFMVAKRIKVYSKSAKEIDSPGHVWISDGSGSYSIAEAEGVQRGTKIIIELADDCDEFSKRHAIETVIKKYSNFVGFDIYLNGMRVNTVQALWTVNESEISEADHKEFYQFISHSHDAPIYHLQYRADSPLQVRSLFYVPETHMEKYGLGIMEPGVSLFARKVLIQARCRGLLPDWLRFIKGVVDSEDIPLNLSRELLQDSTILKRLSNVLTRRILKFFQDQSKLDPSKYLRFYNEFSQFFKQGITTDVKWKNEIATLLRFESSKTNDGELMSLGDYVDRMGENQKIIYYLNVPSRGYGNSSPYYEPFEKKGIEVIFVYNPFDDFVMSSLGQFNDKSILSAESIQANDSIKELYSQDPESDNKLNLEQWNEFSGWAKSVLANRVSQISEAPKWSSSPAIVIDQESAAFRRMMRTVDPSRSSSAPKVQLQINTSHPIIMQLNNVRTSNPKLAGDALQQIMDNAMIQAGLLEDNRAMVDRISSFVQIALSSSSPEPDSSKAS